MGVSVVSAIYGVSATVAATYTVSVFVANMVLTMLASQVMGALFGKKPKMDAGAWSSEMRDRQQVVRSSVQPRNIIYGECMTSGPLVFVASSGASNGTLHMVIVLAGHEVDEIGDVYFNDEIVPLSAGNAVGKFAGFARVVKHLGAPDQAADAELVAASVGWTEAHRLAGVAYLYVRLTFDSTLFASGIPNVKAVVRGKKVYDPRNGATAWSNNWALCVRDYLVSPLGLGAADEVDDIAIVIAANISDEPVTVAVGEVQRRYTCDGSLVTSTTPREVLRNLLTAGVGKICFTGGKYVLFAGAFRTPSPDAITEDDLRGQLQLQARTPRRELFNAVRGTYADPAKYWQPSDFPPVRNATYRGQDAGEEIWRDIELPYTIDPYRAQRIARIHLEQSRQGITVIFPGKYTLFSRKVGDVVPLTVKHLGWDRKLFSVERWALAAEGGVDLVLRETSPSMYEWSMGEATTIDPAPDTNLPDPSDIPAPTNLILARDFVTQANGVEVARLLCTWTAPASAWVTGYEVAWSENGGPWNIQPSIVPRIVIPGIVSGAAYEVRVRSVSMTGAHSPWTTSSDLEFQPPVLPPAAPINVTATGGMLCVRLAWTFGDTRADIRATEVWFAAVNDRSAAVRLSAQPYPSREYTHPALQPGHGGYYWVRVVDTWENASEWFPADASGGMYRSPSADPADLLDYLKNAVGADQLTAELAQPISILPGLGARLDWDEETADIQALGRTALLKAERAHARAEVLTETTVRASEIEAIASQTRTALAQIGNDYAAVQETISATASAVDGMRAKYLLQVDANGHVSAIQLSSDENGGALVFLADKLLFAMPDGSGAPKQVVVVGKIGGVPALGLDGNLLVDGSISARQITLESLSEVAGSLGTFSSSPNGGRLEISDHVIRVFDAAGTLRVKLGNLSA